MLFKSADNCFAREMFGSVEGHMFKKMCETVLVVVFKRCTYILDNIEAGSFFRLLIVTDKVGEPVGKLPCPYFRIHWSRPVKILGP